MGFSMCCMAKRGSSDRESCFDSAEMDLKRERDFLDMHPAPRGDEYYANIATIRSDKEIAHRERLIEKLSKPGNPVEYFNFNKVQYGLINSGIILSNIFFSYIIGNRVKTPEIDFKIFYQKAFKSFMIHIKDLSGSDLPKELVDLHKYTLKHHVRKWLEQSHFKDYIDAYAFEVSKKSSMTGTTGEGRSKLVEIGPAVLMIRRCAMLNVEFLKSGKLIGHQLFMFWQLHEKNNDFIIEYGICDNLRLQQGYQLLQKNNYNFHDVIQEAFRDYFRDSDVRYGNINFMFIHNQLPYTRINQEHYKDMCYNCVAMARRAVMYFAIFYDISKLNFNKDVEHLIDHSVSHDEAALTRKELLYIRNLKGYSHYMNKMFEWLLSAPQLWPRYDPALPDEEQEMPTESKPLCLVLFPFGFYSGFPREYLYRVGPDQDLWIELNNDMAYIRLFDLIKGKMCRYYFHMDGGEVFRAERSQYGGGTCAVSAAADIGDLSIVLSALHERLELLELSPV